VTCLLTCSVAAATRSCSSSNSIYKHVNKHVTIYDKKLHHANKVVTYYGLRTLFTISTTEKYNIIDVLF